MVLSRPLGIGLLSGGLDSALACRILTEAGADVRCLHFFTGFCVTGHHNRVGRRDKPMANDVLQVGAELGVPVELVDISAEFIDIVLHPRYGYGANMNPCIDCREFMLRKTKAYMEEVDADFVFTGEVIGQRPMSQTRNLLDAIEKRTGLKGRLLRPLSARLLPPTLIEQAGRIDRDKLLALHGRSRKAQLELAVKYGLTKFAQPGGVCCFLTDQAYSRKFRDVLKFRGERAITMDDIYQLGVGRHFRLSPVLKVIIGRDEIENNFLSKYDGQYWTAAAVDFPGPTVLIMGEFDEKEAGTIAAMTARYSDGKREAEVEVEFSFGDVKRRLRTVPASDDLVDSYRV
jgi:tRNA-specific 2-thiouridylase